MCLPAGQASAEPVLSKNTNELKTYAPGRFGIIARCLRCLLLVMCTHPFAREALTLHLARREGHERYLDCNLMHRRVLASSHQHLMAEAPLEAHARPERRRDRQAGDRERSDLALDAGTDMIEPRHTRASGMSS